MVSAYELTVAQDVSPLAEFDTGRVLWIVLLMELALNGKRIFGIA
jgi:hypothetical protein